MNAKVFIGAGAGMVAGALLMVMVGSWTTSAQEERDRAVALSAGYVTEEALPVRVAPRRVNAVRTVSAPAPVRRVATATATRVAPQIEPKRSWKKTALVIGGSAGAGAGVGALAGGKKGALIGAAIGGGAASIFEAIKR